MGGRGHLDCDARGGTLSQTFPAPAVWEGDEGGAESGLGIRCVKNKTNPNRAKADALGVVISAAGSVPGSMALC